MFNHNLNYEQIEHLFSRFSENKESLLYDQFETLVIEGDLLSINSFDTYMKIKDDDVNTIIIIKIRP
jgi:hypothetical protein